MYPREDEIWGFKWLLEAKVRRLRKIVQSTAKEVSWILYRKALPLSPHNYTQLQEHSLTHLILKLIISYSFSASDIGRV